MNVAILLSGGTGTRVGADRPKQYIEVKGKPVIAYAFDVIQKSSVIDRICIVAEESWQDYILSFCEADEEILFAKPGRNRQESILHGLQEIKKQLDGAGQVESVFVHDAARPYLTDSMITEYYEALTGYEGVLPVLPMKDTVYLSEDGKTVTALLNRSQIYAGQAPEIFLFHPYLAANEALLPEKILFVNGSTEPAVMAGMNIKMVPGEERNTKITTPLDLQKFIDNVT